ncbi:tRNA (guanosine(37)-N1)-methyltransferase TrmD [Actinobaculum sp. 352]|uniref:tRNA (guanosine(37)-N1)-methyltransferase TrmD n=1 Tax=Actinobaculum sp. 352 TaxID=2490946 RepID=UPI000F7E67BF|nr:tRNA (guanosine(37)-N1)-methyltransferase TrmD [Actinobaculum sp. 352]RTE49486.1 tRNA (guanosine(37)-N1)-methyltransferase TrmD [Actinobaculum sp. 352]
MRFDIVSVFPAFFSVLDLSLVGKAQNRGLLDVACHDLRDWTDDPHRTVDDTPAGGGAGMVMRADIWGKALDDFLGGNDAPHTPVPSATVLAIPTPSARPLTQRDCERLAAAEHIVIACGRYEGIDARVAEYYTKQGVTVFEYSLGDYVLNGGEVAAVALVEAVGRLLPGMVGNPESLVEESHGAAGLLEYPVYTRPAVWRGLEIPGVLASGDHGAVARWRREQALARTASRRPDMIRALDTASLNKRERRALAASGFLALRGCKHPVPVHVRPAKPSEAAELAELAAETFPDACPPWLSEADITAFIAEHLSVRAFADYLDDPHWVVTVLAAGCQSPSPRDDCDWGGGQGEACERFISPGSRGESLFGYTLCLLPPGRTGEAAVAVGSGEGDEGDVAGEDEGAPVDAVVEGTPRRGELIELSKFYLRRYARGSGAQELLWDGTRRALLERITGAEPYIWLGTNEGNRRAQQAYKKLGFHAVSTRIFAVGDQDNSDVIFARRLRVP